jgi:hypothetical protein
MPLPETFAELKAEGGVMVYLPRDRSRAEYSLAKLHAVGFENIELTEGVDAHTADVRRLAASEGWLFGPDVTPGEAGCALAMFRLWRRVVARGLPLPVDLRGRCPAPARPRQPRAQVLGGDAARR